MNERGPIKRLPSFPWIVFLKEWKASEVDGDLREDTRERLPALRVLLEEVEAVRFCLDQVTGQGAVFATLDLRRQRQR